MVAVQKTEGEAVESQGVKVGTKAASVNVDNKASGGATHEIQEVCNQLANLKSLIKNGNGDVKSKNKSWPNNGHSHNTMVMDPHLVAPLSVATAARPVKENKLLIQCYKCMGGTIPKGIVPPG